MDITECDADVYKQKTTLKYYKELIKRKKERKS
jgi:hypothetical protein